MFLFYCENTDLTFSSKNPFNGVFSFSLLQCREKLTVKQKVEAKDYKVGRAKLEMGSKFGM